MAHLLEAEAPHLEYPTRVVFDAVTVRVSEGDGTSPGPGMPAGTIEPDSGRVVGAVSRIAWS